MFDPVARALDLIGDKWTLVLVRHLLAGPVGFQHLRVRTGITARVLSARLRQLAAKGLVETVAGEGGRSLYAVTDSGRELAPVVAALARWYVHHAVEDLDTDVVALHRDLAALDPRVAAVPAARRARARERT